MKSAVVAALLALAISASASVRKSAVPRGLAPLFAGAAPTSGAVVFPVGDMRAQLAQYIASALAKGSAGTTLENYGSYQLRLSVLGRSGPATILPHWSDVIVVQQGSVKLITGGHIVDPRSQADGEILGSRIEGGQSQIIAAGDVVSLRAGTPHQFLLAPRAVCSAFVIRIHEP